MSRPPIKLFLDVDGVLLGHSPAATGGYGLADNAIEFLQFVLEEFDVAWATTQCRDGAPAHVVGYIADHSPLELRQRVAELTREIRATSFNVSKTDLFPADSKERWLWIDDSPLAFELEQLRQRGLLDRWIEINTVKRPDDLHRAIELLRGLR